MNSQHDESTLLAFVRREEDGRNKICIYGTPGGLRKLASELVKQSEANQDHLADYDTDHTHYRATHQNAILAASSDEVVLGRLDLRNGELATWARERIDNQRLPPVAKRYFRIFNLDLVCFYEKLRMIPSLPVSKDSIWEQDSSF
jgi:hypothetical protein